jgi:hypothetical protein
MASHDRAAFSTADVPDSKRGYPDFHLRDYATRRGLEFVDHGTPAGYRAFPATTSTTTRTSIPAGRSAASWSDCSNDPPGGPEWARDRSGPCRDRSIGSSVSRLPTSERSRTVRCLSDDTTQTVPLLDVASVVLLSRLASIGQRRRPWAAEPVAHLP